MLFRLRLRAPSVLLASCLFLVGAPEARAQDEQLRLTAGGVERRYSLHVPRSIAHSDVLAPLVLAFHGGTGTGAGMASLTHFDDVADRYGFIVAYPEGVGRQWNDGLTQSTADDLSFVRAIVEDVHGRHPLDRSRLYAAGMSNGGFFSQVLACRLADTFAAVASVAATMPEALLPECHPSCPVSVMFVMGDADRLVPIGGGPVAGNGRPIVSLESAVDFWVERDRAAVDPVIERLPHRDFFDGTRTRREVHSGGAQETGVVTYVVEYGGHTWPGGKQYLPVFLIGRTSRDFDASNEIWDFFRQHPRQVKGTAEHGCGTIEEVVISTPHRPSQAPVSSRLRLGGAHKRNE